MKKGKVVEIGNHEELIELNGLYTSLVSCLR
jgi:ABC-type multidrug transport system fused ATPase/permease subunit